MPKKSAVLFFFILLPQLCFAQAPDTLWTKTFGGNNEEQSKSVQVTSDNGYIIAGHTKSYGLGDYDVYLVRTDENGDSLWTRTYGDTASDIGNCVQQTNDFGFIIAGHTMSYGAGDADVYLIKTNSIGDTSWTKTYGGEDWDWANYIQQTSDGGYITVGRTQSFGFGNGDVYIIKTDLNGDSLWTQTFGGTGMDEALSVQEIDEGGYIIVGSTESFGAGEYDIYLIKIDENGDSLWTKTFGGSDSDMGQDVKITMDGGFIISGFTASYGNGYFDTYLIKTDENGDSIWTKTYGGTELDWGNSIIEDLRGGYTVSGYTNSYGLGSYDVYLIRTNYSGDTLWTKTIGGVNSDYSWSINQLTNGEYIISGHTNSFGNGNLDIYLICIEPDPVEGIVIHVPGDFPTIQAGINASQDGDTVLVADGIYIGTGNKDLDFYGKAIVVMSENGAEDCIIDCQNSGRGFSFSSGEDSTSILSGFKIINGLLPLENNGGAIFVSSSSPKIIDCIFEGNEASNGGGIFCQSNSNPKILRCVFNNNSINHPSGNGGGMSIRESNPTIENCTFYGNQGNVVGGGIYYYSSSSNTKNCIFSNNTASDGGGVYGGTLSNPFVTYCNFYDNNNSNFSGNGIPANFGELVTVNANLDSCDIYRNIFFDPLFIDPTSNNYNLQSTSPCIDAGDPTSPLDPDNTIADMGAFYFYHSPYIIRVPGDYPTIQAGINAANNGDTVLVADGTYAGVGNKNLDYTGKAIVVMSENGAETCIIDCENNGRGVYFHLMEDSNSVFDGFTISNGNPQIDNGGGIFITNGSDALIKNCRIQNCEAGSGGGIYILDGSNPIINGCLIFDNSATNSHGGGIYCFTSNPIIENCTIVSNTAQADGGGIVIANYSIPVILNTIISDNFGNGGIIFFNAANASIEYCDIYNNENGNFGVYVPPGIGVINSTNTNGDSCDQYYNIFLDPLFQSTTGDSAYRLTAESPCIDAGDPASPLDPDNTIADMGAFYFHHVAPITVSDDSLFFPPTEIGKSDSLPLMVYNTGTEDIVLYSMSIGLPGIFSVNWYPMDYTLTAGDSLEFEAFFAPLDTVEYDDTLRIYTSYATLNVYLRGEGVEGTFMDVSDKTTNLPIEYAFHNPYPNPFNPETMLAFDLPDAGDVLLVIYDVLGREVYRLIDGWQNPGYYQTTFSGESLSSGIYFVKLEAGDYRQIKKILLVK